MNLIFEKEYVNYNQITNVDLLDINEILIENDLFLDIGDDFCNDWAGYCFYYCKKQNELDDKTIASFIYIITGIMTGVPIEFYPNFKSETYYKNEKILSYCLELYNNVIKYYNNTIDICKELFERIYLFYVSNHKDYMKRSERINCLLTYNDMKLFDNVEGKSRSDKIKTLLNNYYK